MRSPELSSAIDSWDILMNRASDAVFAFGNMYSFRTIAPHIHGVGTEADVEKL
jgi:hypothetical protein